MATTGNASRAVETLHDAGCAEDLDCQRCQADSEVAAREEGDACGSIRNSFADEPRLLEIEKRADNVGDENAQRDTGEEGRGEDLQCAVLDAAALRCGGRGRGRGRGMRADVAQQQTCGKCRYQQCG